MICYADFKLYHVRCLDYRFTAPPVKCTNNTTPVPVVVEHLVSFEAWTGKADAWVSAKRLLPMYGKNVFHLQKGYAERAIA